MEACRAIPSGRTPRPPPPSPLFRRPRKPPPRRPLLREFAGINGHTVQFRPDLYATAFRKVHDYHSLSWDLGKDTDYVPRVINIVPEIGEAGRTTIYVRRYNPRIDGEANSDQPYVAISNRCMHLGCPVRYVSASQRFICPCHGGVYDATGRVAAGPPPRPLEPIEAVIDADGSVLVRLA